jgi:Fe-Mn family superoxide dismutase
MFQPINLPYSFDALEPYIDKETMKVHYTKHYFSYTKNLNELLKKHNISSRSIEKIIKNSLYLPKKIQDNAGGYYNHTLFWNMLKPNNKKSNLPYGASKELIKKDFGGYANFLKQIKNNSKERFGSGWVWWIINPNGRTEIVQTPYQDNPKMYENVNVLLGIDVWEHAYYLKHQADRQGYIDDIMNVIDWEYPNRVIETNYFRY